MTTCNHEYIEWRGREVCQECGVEKDYTNE